MGRQFRGAVLLMAAGALGALAVVQPSAIGLAVSGGLAVGAAVTGLVLLIGPKREPIRMILPPWLPR